MGIGTTPVSSRMGDAAYRLRGRWLGLYVIGMMMLLQLTGCSLHLEPDEDRDGYPQRRDCDDLNEAIHPGAQETCNGIDDDCDARVDDADSDPGPIGTLAFYADTDIDGYGSAALVIEACECPPNYVLNRLDCDDSDPSVHPGGREACDGIDNDCDDKIDDDDTDAIPESVLPWYRDGDSDGYGDPSAMVLACVCPIGYVSLSSGYLDCDDADASHHPGAYEVCDGFDNDCDGEIDDDTAQTTAWYPDIDTDGHGSQEEAVVSCPGPTGWVVVADDCNDRNPSIYVGAEESCDGLDNDCDLLTDEGLLTTFYPDADGDGFGTETGALQACIAPDGYVEQVGDCNDTSAQVWPGAPVICDGRDDNCDGQIDVAGARYYRDADGDGFGNELVRSCFAQDGYVQTRGDCDDDSNIVHPGAKDQLADGQDSDCGGSDDAEPHVGLSSSSLGSIQSALDAARNGATVWVGPGRYQSQDVNFKGKSCRLISTHLAAETVLDIGRVNGYSALLFASGESAGSVVDGFGITGAVGGLLSAGITVLGASPTLIGLHFFDNYLTNVGDGAALYLKWSNSVIRDCLFERNNSDGFGGAIYMESSQPMLEHCTIQDNTAEWGGGIYADSSRPTLNDVQVLRNKGWTSSGGIYLVRSSATVNGCEIRENQGGGVFAYFDSSLFRSCQISGNQFWGLFASDASYTMIMQSRIESNRGAGVLLGGGIFTIKNVRISDNVSDSDGGGVYLYGAQATFEQVILSGNSARNTGGAILNNASDVTLKHSVVALNEAAQGCGGIDFEPATPGSLTIEGSIVAYNSGFNLCGRGQAAFSSAVSDYYAPDDKNFSEIALPSEGVNWTLEPGFLRYDSDGMPMDFHLATDSWLRDADLSDVTDPDGSPGDIGCYGGIEGASWDLDVDGYPAYFWPGTYEQWPDGISPELYDSDDGDPSVPLSTLLPKSN